MSDRELIASVLLAVIFQGLCLGSIVAKAHDECGGLSKCMIEANTPRITKGNDNE